MKKRTAWGMCAAWMAVIFWMSSMPGEVSGAQSSMLVRLLVRFLSAVLGHGMTEQLPLAAIELALRKAAHLAEYAVLGLLFQHALRCSGARRACLWAVVLSAAYAATDELHQYFIPLRTASLMDVLIDTLSASLACALDSLRLRRKAKKAA